MVGVLARDEQVGFADGVCLRIEFLPVYLVFVMLPAGLVAHFGELHQKLLEDLPHGMVIHHIGMQVHRAELLDKQEQALFLCSFSTGLSNWKFSMIS